MGRKSRMKRERRDQTFTLAEVLPSSLALVLHSEGTPIEELLADPVLQKYHMTGPKLLGLLDAWNRKTPADQEQMLEVAWAIVEQAEATLLPGRK